MTDRTTITLNAGFFAIAERQDNYALIGRYITTTVVLSADDWQEIASIVERAERRKYRGRTDAECANPNFKPGISHD